MCEPGDAIDAHAALLLEVDEQQANSTRLDDVSHRQVHAIAVVVGERERRIIDDGDEARVATFVRACRLAGRVDTGEKEHVETLDERLVIRGEAIMHLHFRETVREPARVEMVLQLAAPRRVHVRHTLPPRP